VIRALVIDPGTLAGVTGGQGRTWGTVGREYAAACADGMVSSVMMTGVPTPYTLGVGCVAGMAGQGAVDAITAYRDRRR
jgi:hypothetical protein